jgi:hypothetical protein
LFPFNKHLLPVQMADVLREVQAMDGVGAEQLRATGAGKMVTALGKELKGQPLMQDAAAAARLVHVGCALHWRRLLRRLHCQLHCQLAADI